jgi:hypothetical protein
MHLEQFSEREKEIVGEILRAAVEGPFFPEWEFHTLFGLEREEIRRIANDWPTPTEAPENILVAVNNSFNNLLGYPHGQEASWSDWISVDQRTASDLFDRIRGKSDERIFDRMM